MTMHHVLEQLPLWVEGDLDRPKSDAVQAHLALCSSCRTAAQDLITSQTWLREAMAPPFEASDHDRLRRAVMDRIRSEPSRQPLRRLALRPALLAACAAALLLATLTWRQERPVGIPQPAAEGPVAALVAEPPTKPAPPPRLAHLEAARAAPLSVLPRPAEASTAPAREEPARIEFQTSDPTIHIIWLARATPLPGTTLPLQEEP